MITILTAEPEGYVQTGDRLTGAEFTRILTLPLKKLLVTDVSDRHARTLVQQSGTNWTVKRMEDGMIRLLYKGSPRPGVSARDIDQAIAWHAQRIADLVSIREQTVQAETAQMLKGLEQTVAAATPPPETVVSPSGSTMPDYDRLFGVMGGGQEEI